MRFAGVLFTKRVYYKYYHLPLCILVSRRQITLATVWSQIRPDILSGLIRIQSVWHSDGIPEIFFWKKMLILGEINIRPNEQ